MSITASVVDGVLQQSSTSASSLSQSTKSSDALDKEDFLKLLVAQMQYQDPLEPTSNTEYISQFATFSELEQMQNVSNSMDMYRASNLVGQTVIMKVTSNSTGETSEVMGKVDYVMYESNKAYLSINGNLYSIDDLDTVVDADYLTALDKTQAVATQVAKLPKVEKLTINNREEVEAALAAYDALSDYEKTFFQQDAKDLIESYRDKIKELIAIAQAAENTEDNEDTEDTVTEEVEI
jgi:flagellar basal-body rod modification protein FlgD